MSSQTASERYAEQREPWVASWEALRDYQLQVADFWLSALNAWPYFSKTSGDPAESEPFNTDVEAAGSRQPSPTIRVIDQPQPAEQSRDAQGDTRKARSAAPAAGPQEDRSQAAQPTRRRGPRGPSPRAKGPERTGRAASQVIAGLRHRSYSAKLAAVSAMKTNKKLCTPQTIPLLERIVNNQTIRRRDPELRSAAQTVLRQSRQETRQHSSSKRKPR